MKKYNAYKDSGVKWIGEIPSHWGLRRAKYMFNKEKREVRDIDDVVTCFRDGEVTLRKNRRTTGFTESFTEIGYQGVRKGDLVIHQMDLLLVLLAFLIQTGNAHLYIIVAHLKAAMMRIIMPIW